MLEVVLGVVVVGVICFGAGYVLGMLHANEMEE